MNADLKLARDNIYVNCVGPVWVDTEMAAPALNDPEMSKRVYSTIPLGRMGKPEEIAASGAFPVYSPCRVHHGRDPERKWGRRTGRMKQELVIA